MFFTDIQILIVASVLFVAFMTVFVLFVSTQIDKRDLDALEKKITRLSDRQFVTNPDTHKRIAK